MNIALLKSKMALAGEKQVTLATALCITETSLSAKLSGKTPFKVHEIDMITKRYQLTGDELKEIFFSEGGVACDENDNS